MNNSPTHPRNRIVTKPGEPINRFGSDQSPTLLPVDISEAGLRRLGVAAMEAMRESERHGINKIDPRLALAWERAVAQGEVGDPNGC